MKTGGRSHRSNRFWRIPICWRTPICWQQRTIRWLPGIRLEARIARGFLGRRHDRPFYQSTTSPSPRPPVSPSYVRSMYEVVVVARTAACYAVHPSLVGELSTKIGPPAQPADPNTHIGLSVSL